MNTLNIYPKGLDNVQAHFEVIICDKAVEFSEWVDNGELENSVFIENVSHVEQMLKLGTILIRKDKLESKYWVAQVTRAATIFAELMSSLQDSLEGLNDYHRDILAQASEFIFNEIETYLEKHYVSFEEND